MVVMVRLSFFGTLPVAVRLHLAFSEYILCIATVSIDVECCLLKMSMAFSVFITLHTNKPFLALSWSRLRFEYQS